MPGPLKSFSGFLWLPLLLLPGCTGETGAEIPFADTGVELCLSATDGGTATRSGEAGGPLAEGTELGIYALSDGNNFLTENSGNCNTWYRVLADGAVSPDKEPARVPLGKACTLYGYAPRHYHKVEEIQADEVCPVVRHGDDVLWAREEIGSVSETNRYVTMCFTHRAALVRFVLEPGTGATAEDLRDAELVATGFARTGTLSLATGKISADADPEEAEIRNIYHLDRSLPVAVIPGQRSIRLKLTLGEHAASPGVKETTVVLPLDPGTYYKYTLTYHNARPLELRVSIEPWKLEDSGEIEI